jgi:hypothetical protein
MSVQPNQLQYTFDKIKLDAPQIKKRVWHVERSLSYSIRGMPHNGKQHVVLLFCHRSKPPQCPFGSCVTRRLHFLVHDHVLQLILMHFPTEKLRFSLASLRYHSAHAVADLTIPKPGYVPGSLASGA